MKSKKIAIWFGYKVTVNFNNEGIGRVLYYMMESLIKNYNYHIDLFCYKFNETGIKRDFVDKLDHKGLGGFVRVITNDADSLFLLNKCFVSEWRKIKCFKNISYKAGYINFKSSVKSNKNIFNKAYLIFLSFILLLKGICCKILVKFGFVSNFDSFEHKQEYDASAMKFNSVSDADCVIIPLVTLDNGLKLNKQKIVLLWDLVTLEYYDLFVKNNPEEKIIYDKGKEITQKYIDTGAYFITISEYVITNQLLRYCKNVDLSKVFSVYLPCMVSENIDYKLLSENDLKLKYKLKNPYIFFPSQNRPHKNLITLLKAIKEVNERGYRIDLVITGRLQHNVDCFNFVKENEKLRKYVFEVYNLTDIELYSFYKHALAMVSPSLFEGGFPLQAMEALYFDTPVILADILVTKERLQSIKYQKNNGILFFEPHNSSQLADLIIKVYNKRSFYIKKQKKLRDKILSYTWDDVAKQYYEIIQKVVAGGRV